MKLTAKVVALTFVGGAIGTALRAISSFVPDFFFTNFWFANMLGVVAIAIFNNIQWFAIDSRKAFFIVGMSGGFTTMSALSALVLFSWQTVLTQALFGVAIYVLVGVLLKRVARGN